MESFKINGTDIIFQDFEKKGQGKIIIADNWRGAFTYSWGAMGGNINTYRYYWCIPSAYYGIRRNYRASYSSGPAGEPAPPEPCPRLRL